MNNTSQNPFEYEAATKFTAEDVVEYYCEDYNYSRFVHSTRNVFLVGGRGVGKTMTLRYYSLPAEVIKRPKNPSLDVCCIYVPCQNPLTHKAEYELYDNAIHSALSEHNLVVQIMFSIATELDAVAERIKSAESEKRIREIFSYLLGMEIPTLGNGIWGRRGDLAMAIQQHSNKIEKAVNGGNEISGDILSFNSGVRTLLSGIKLIPQLSNTHFSLMLDDVQHFNSRQIELINSWISYRDNTDFSFKIATTDASYPTYHTSAGQSILEGHDYIRINMECPHQNKRSEFGKLARDIIERRLRKVGIKSTTLEDFFPCNPDFEKNLDAIKKTVEAEAIEKYPPSENKGKEEENKRKKKIEDHIYKYSRPRLFQSFHPKRNIPPYSGLETIVRLSTGVVRYLLEPCYWMYDAALSESDGKSIPNCISPIIQSAVIRRLSERKWDWLKEGLKQTEVCSEEEAKYVYQLLDKLAVYFSDRLLHHKSEPGALSFIITEQNSSAMKQLQPILDIAREAQVLYTFTSSARERSERTTRYMFNRILCPVRKLDPYEQHATASIKASVLWRAASMNKNILLSTKISDSSERSLFDGLE